ncbi:hypothetical protein HY68_37880 [Streptomyces sp. AcH 505]|nr:hypothetical protein HY68_37880 [Streptomyces sp. AcH 505]
MPDAVGPGESPARGRDRPSCRPHGNTPLWRAVFCSQGEGATIRLLLEAGADADRDSGHGMSPRVLAGRVANYDVAAHLPAGDATSS